MEAAAATAPAATEAAAPEVPVSAASHGLDAILGDLSADDVGANENATEGQPEGETTEAPETEAEAKPAKRDAPDDVIFSEEQLRTPEGIKRARGRLQELQKKQHEAFLGLKGYEKRVVEKANKLKTKVGAFRTEKTAFEWERNTFRQNLQGLRAENPETILSALGSLTNMDGLKAYELLTSHIVNRGKAPLDPQVQAVLDEHKREIEELRRGTAERQAAERVQQVQTQIRGHEQRIGEMIRSSTSTPHLTRIFNEDPARLTKHIVDAITEDNGATPAHQLFAEMERELQQHFGAAAPQGNGGGPAPKQPVTAQRSPGQSVGPRTAAASTPRVPSEEESLRSIANDPELLSALGL